MTSTLPKQLQPALKALEKDLLARARLPTVESGLRVAWEGETEAGQTGFGFDLWRRERVTQIAVAWILSLVFVRTLEDRTLIEPRVSGLNAETIRAAEDREAQFLQFAPFLGIREYLLSVFRELSRLPGTRDVFDTKHNPVWVLSPSSEGAQALVDFFRKRNAAGLTALVFAGEDTRFLGDLYQDLSEAVRKRYALLQTPEFVEEFILDQTLDPAIAEFGLRAVTLIDPTCGSGHFLLGAFRRLLGRWQQHAPTESIADLARRALNQVYGVDINPYAVAIARFRLVLALLDAVGIKRLEGAPDIKPNVVVADSLLHRFEQQTLSVGQISMDDDLRWGDRIFRLESRGDVEQVLTKRFHAVVGNPPYITEKDKRKRAQYAEMYASASGRFALGAVFTERFFELATEGGFVGLINTNAWTKRDYGKALADQVLPKLDLSSIVDMSGCYVPGHGTPTLLLFGRNRAPAGGLVRAVLGKRGERAEPLNPAEAPVWLEILGNHSKVGWDGSHVSVEHLSREDLRRHPWVLAGGGGRQLLAAVEAASRIRLNHLATDIGYDTITSASDLLELSADRYSRLAVERDVLLEQVDGDSVRDWQMNPTVSIPVPYDRTTWKLTDLSKWPGLAKFLWPHRGWLSQRWVSGGTRMTDVGLPHWAIPQLAAHKHLVPFRIALGAIATHNHFVLDRDTRVFKQTALIANLKTGTDEDGHLSLIGYLNSSLVAFWGRLVFFQKGGDQVGEGARLSKTPWQDRIQMAGNQLGNLPIPDPSALLDSLLGIVKAAEDCRSRILADSAERAVTSALQDPRPSLDVLRRAREEYTRRRAHLRLILVSLQEEIDWRVYGLLGLPTIVAPSLDAVLVPVEPNNRPFEVRLAREITGDISASEWFRVHRREAPNDVGGPLSELFRSRLRLLDDPERGKHLRLLETPETKRRWPPADDERAFSDAVRTWLLGRIELAFRTLATPELRTARQIALELGLDGAVSAAHEFLTGESGLELVKLVSELIEAEGVPYLACFRYAETGLEKRSTWEEAWRLQRLEDSGLLDAELERLGIKSIPTPEKYGNKDFLRHYWSLRGKLDVPKERFVTIPGGNTDEDTTVLVGWAGWNHLQVAQALAGLYQRRKTDDGWTKDRLVPLLAGLDERVPWLLQWHNEPSASFGGMKLGEFFRDFVATEAHALGLVVDDLRKWTPPTAAKRTAIDNQEVLAALKNWTPEVEEDVGDDDESEPPEGPTEADLSSMVGVTKSVLKKTLKKLEADGLVEKLSGRPVRYVATGDEA